MKIESIKLFSEVVKHGSFTRAADHLLVSKAFLSQQVKMLEQDLNKQLLVRNTRNMRLTSAGETLFSQAKKLSDFCQETQALLDLADDKLSGLVKCTAPVGLTKYLLSPIVNDLMKLNPDISISINSNNNLHNLISEDFDFALRLTNTPPQDMIAKQLAEVSYVCCCTPEFAKKFGLPSSPEELNKFACLVLPHFRIWTFSDNERIYSINMKGKFVASDNDILKQTCINHLGIAHLPDYIVKSQIMSGELIHVLKEYSPEKKKLYLLYPQINSRPKRVTMCIESIIKSIGNI